MKRSVSLIAFLALILVGAACGGDDDTSSSTTITQDRTTTSAAGTTSTTGAVAETAARVYYAKGEKIATAGRSVDASAPEEGAVRALLEGPDDFEAGIGMGTQIPGGTDLLGLAIDAGRATVDLSGSFQSGGGSLSMQLRTAQVVFTLTQFDTVETVTIHLDGETVEGIGGEGIPAADLTRADFEDVTPFILVESPVPGERVSSPLTVSGISNTFEATVRYSITDPEGLILEEGFTTASAGNGVWADFSISVDFTSERAGLGAVITWEDSADTGQQVNVYEVPVRMG
jgi:hypothetical protein